MFALLVAASLPAAPVARGSSVLPTPGGHLALAHGILSGPNSQDLVQVARSFAISHRAELGLPITSSLGTPQTFSTRFGGTVHLPQLVDGLEVDGGKLNGDRIRAFNCCPTANCQADAGPKRAAGMIQVSQTQFVGYDLAICDLPLAQAQMKQVFDARGVSSCSKVLDVTDNPTPREAYIIPGTTFAELAPSTAVPGPYQMKIRVPNGTKSLTVSGPYFGGGMTVRVGIVAKVNAPITFTRGAGQTLLHDANKAVTPTVGGGMMKGTVSIDVPCGGELFFTVTNTSLRDRQLQNLAFTYTPADSCAVVPDAGVPDAGNPDAGGLNPGVGDAGTPKPSTVTIHAVPDSLGAVAVKTGCGCSGGVGGFFRVALLGAPLLWRRRN